MNEKYRRRAHPVVNLDEIKESEIRTVLNRIDKQKVNRSRPFLKVLVPLTAVLVAFLLLQRVIFPNHNINPFTVTKVSAQEYNIDSKDILIAFKSFAVSENELVQYNDDFSYYPTLSKYTDRSDLIGKDIQVNIKLYTISNRHFIEVNCNGNITYWEIVVSDYLSVEEIKGLQITDFEQDMQNILNLVNEYPPVELSQTGMTKSYSYNEQISHLADSRDVENYKAYVTDNYQPLRTKPLTVKTGFVFNYVITVDDNDHVLSESPFIHMVSGIQNQNELDNYFFNPVTSGFNIALNYSHTLKNLDLNFSNEDLSGIIKLKTYITCDNAKYNRQTVAFLLIDNPKSFHIGKIELDESGRVFTFDDVHTYNDYVYSFPMIITDSSFVYDLTLAVYDSSGSVILSRQFNPVGLY